MGKWKLLLCIYNIDQDCSIGYEMTSLKKDKSQPCTTDKHLQENRSAEVNRIFQTLNPTRNLPSYPKLKAYRHEGGQTEGQRVSGRSRQSPRIMKETRIRDKGRTATTSRANDQHEGLVRACAPQKTSSTVAREAPEQGKQFTAKKYCYYSIIITNILTIIITIASTTVISIHTIITTNTILLCYHITIMLLSCSY